MTSKARLRMKIIEEILEAFEKNTATISHYQVDKPVSFRKVLRSELNNYNIDLGRIKMMVGDNELIVFIKAMTRTEQLERLVRKMMLHVDDEKLYDEALEVLSGI